jgi:hypothetical protein
MNYETFVAINPSCANTCPVRRGAFTTCAEQPSLSACWKPLKRGAPQLELWSTARRGRRLRRHGRWHPLADLPGAG